MSESKVNTYSLDEYTKVLQENAELKRIIAESHKQELTEVAIDAPRGFFMGLELGCKNLEDMRDHMDRCGYDYSMWPDWAKVETGHITKSGKAIIVWSMMLNASKEGV